jgi:biotin carboxyl carrier protein
MTGTFYSTPGADKLPFVKEGSKVKEGETICILEAMKLFNEIEAPFNCKIVKILVEDGTLVKKGQPIMAIEKI